MWAYIPLCLGSSTSTTWGAPALLSETQHRVPCTVCHVHLFTFIYIHVHWKLIILSIFFLGTITFKWTSFFGQYEIVNLLKSVKTVKSCCISDILWQSSIRQLSYILVYFIIKEWGTIWNHTILHAFYFQCKFYTCNNMYGTNNYYMNRHIYKYYKFVDKIILSVL